MHVSCPVDVLIVTITHLLAFVGQTETLRQRHTAKQDPHGVGSLYPSGHKCLRKNKIL